MISDLKFSQYINASETSEFWCNVDLAAILRYCCLVKEGRVLKVAQQFAILGLVPYKPVAYKKCSFLELKLTKIFR